MELKDAQWARKDPGCQPGMKHVYHSVTWGCTQNPGVWGNDGGGITTLEVCEHCQTYRKAVSSAHSRGHTYTFAQLKEAGHAAL